MADFSSLLADPGFQFGLSLLGNAHSLDPFAKAQASMMAFQKQQADQQLMATQQQRMQQQTVNEKQQQAIALQNFLVQRSLMQNVQNLPALGGAGVPQSQLPNPADSLPPVLQALLGQQGMNAGNTTGMTQQAMQQQPPAGAPQINLGNSQPLPQDNGQGAPGPAVPEAVQPPDVQVSQLAPPPNPMGPVDRFGTPLSILASLGNVESSNNPHAIGPPIKDANGKIVNAIGKYQFIPSTVDMLAKQGITGNPMIPAQAQDMASQYLQQLQAKNGGDWTKTLADYGGFNKTDPTGYVNKVLAGAGGLPPTAGGPPSPAQPPTPTPADAAGMPNSGAPLLQAGAMMGLVNPQAGNVLVEAGKAMTPTSVTPNAIRVDPLTGKTQILPPSPQQAQETANITPGPNGLMPNDVSKLGLESLGKAQGTLAESRKLIYDYPQSITALQQAKAAMPTTEFTGPAAERKISALKFLNSVIPGANFKEDALNNADTFLSQINQALLTSVHPTGGRMSQQEMGRMETAFGGLQTNPGARTDIINMMISRYRNTLASHNDMAAQYNTAMGKAPHLDYSLNENPPPTVGPLGRQNAAAGITAPSVGTVKGGYMYKGGDPSNKASWAPVPGAQ